MANIVHARNTKTGELLFRIWSCESDSYVTRAMTKVEMRALLLGLAVEDVVEEVDSRMQRAINRGTSWMVGDARNLNAPWDRKRKQ